MSYCRWSSDCYESDIYCYEADSGIRIHVATQKYVSDAPRPVLQGKTTNDHLDYYHACNVWIESAHIEPIGLPYDGCDYDYDTPREAAEKLIELQKVGYHVPQYAIDALLEEGEEEEK